MENMSGEKSGCYLNFRAVLSIKRRGLIVSLFLLFTLYPIPYTPHPALSPAYAAKIHPDAGSTSAAFLKIGAGARAVAMAGAFTGVCDDPYAVYWNPAGLAWLKDRHISLTHNEHFQGLGQELLVYAVEGEKLRFLGSPALKKGTWALALNYFHTPKDMERRSGFYESDPLYPVSASEGVFRAYDLAFSLGYGFARDADTNIGGAVKFITQAIDNESGSSAALDLGATRSFNWLGGRLFTAGVSALNIGPGIKFVSKRYALPFTLRAGLSHRLPETGALVSLDVSKPLDNYPFFALGLEQQLTSRLALRSGYRYRLHGNELGGWSGFSAGLGLSLEKLSFDYAFVPFGDIGDSHRFSLSFRFGDKKSPLPAAAAGNAPASERLTHARLHIYDAAARPFKMSPAGVLYQLEGISAEAPVPAMRFRAMFRGPAPAAFSAAEGELPEKLAAGLPKGARACNSLQMLEPLGNIRGDIEMEFRLSRECLSAPGAAESGAVLLYLSSAGWLEAKHEKISESEAGIYFRARVPQSTHYVIGVRVAERPAVPEVPVEIPAPGGPAETLAPEVPAEDSVPVIP